VRGSIGGKREESLVRLQSKAFGVFADYHQFYLWDRGMTDQAPEEYDEQDVRRRIKAEAHVVSIQPARNTTVPVEVEIHDADPGFDPSAWDHVAEASLHLPTGRLQAHECAGGSAAEFTVAPGWFRVRALYGGLGTIDKAGLTGGDRYRAVLWPAPPAEVRVVKEWVAVE
jgi:hypothetical protein